MEWEEQMNSISNDFCDFKKLSEIQSIFINFIHVIPDSLLSFFCNDEILDQMFNVLLTSTDSLYIFEGMKHE